MYLSIFINLILRFVSTLQFVPQKQKDPIKQTRRELSVKKLKGTEKLEFYAIPFLHTS